MINETDSLLVLGTGAMACLFAARLAAAGVPFTMLGNWPEGIQALQQNGVRFVDTDGSQKTYSVRVTDRPADCNGALFAVVLVKSWQTERAARQLKMCLSPDGTALTLQNGLGNREILAKELGAQRVALGVTTLGANLLGPGQVRPAGEGVTTLSAHPRLAPLADWLRKAGFLVEYAPDANALLWGKLVINAAINPLTALLNVPNGELLARPTAHALMAATGAGNCRRCGGARHRLAISRSSRGRRGDCPAYCRQCFFDAAGCAHAARRPRLTPSAARLSAPVPRPALPHRSTVHSGSLSRRSVRRV